MKSEKRTMPDWLEPYKNEWRTVGKLSEIIAINGPHSFKTWFTAIKHRCRVVEEERGQNIRRYYLVKNVWAMCQAHGMDLIDAQVALSKERDRLDRLVEEKRREYEQLLQRADRASRDLRDAAYQQTKLEQFLFCKNGQHDTPKALLLAIPPAPKGGVYFLIKDDEVVYIGRSKNVLSRMVGHADKSFDRVLMIPIAEDLCGQLEARMIGWFLPPLNTHLMPKATTVYSEVNSETTGWASSRSF